MKINEMISEYNKIYENGDIKQLYSIIPVLEGYKEYLNKELINEPEIAEIEGYQKIIDAIDVVISGIDNTVEL